MTTQIPMSQWTLEDFDLCLNDLDDARREADREHRERIEQIAARHTVLMAGRDKLLSAMGII